MGKVILHCDLNNFFAAVECLYNPSIRNMPVAVVGDIEQRHGIVLAKNNIAKHMGILTGIGVQQLVRICPNIVLVHPNYPRYLRYGREIRRNEYYANYTDKVESYGLDEAWLDITDNPRVQGDIERGEIIADEIRATVYEKYGLTLSIGVSYTKEFAKLASDLRKPDATTVISEKDYQRTAWELPIDKLIFVGQQTAKRMNNHGIYTIGDLANRSICTLKTLFGKNGEMLHNYANGKTMSEVKKYGESDPIQSLGNATTTPRDMRCSDDVVKILHLLADCVGMRLREFSFRGQTLKLHFRDNKLEVFERQIKLSRATNISKHIFDAALELFNRCYTFTSQDPLRTLGIRMSDLHPTGEYKQISLFDIENERYELVDEVMDLIRHNCGFRSIQRGCYLLENGIKAVDIVNVHPVVGYKPSEFIIA